MRWFYPTQFTTESIKNVEKDNVFFGSTEKNVIAQTTLIERLANNKNTKSVGAVLNRAYDI